MQIANKKRTLNAFFFIKTNKIKTNFTLTKRLKPIYKVNNHSMKKIFLPVGSGIGCFDQTKMIVAIVNNYGNKKVGREKVKTNFKLLDIPIIRGVIYFFVGIAYLCKVYSKGLTLDNIEEKDKNITYKIAKKFNIASVYVMFFASLIFGLLYGLFAIGVLPSFVLKTTWGFNGNYYLSTFIIALLRVAILYLTFLCFRFMPFMQELFRFNGACNKAVNSGENKKLSAEASIYHPLNFLNFAFFALLFSVFMVSFLSVQVLWEIDWLINLAIFILCLSLTYEMLYVLSIVKQNWIKDLHIAFAWLYTMTPTVTHLEIVKVTMLEQSYDKDVKEVEKDRVPMSALLAEMQTKLSSNERVEESDYDWLIANVLNINRSEVKLVRSITAKEYRDILRATARRSKGEPISSIFGYVDFYGLRLDVNKKVLSPRMETEILVEEVLKEITKRKNPEVCDLCTGSGAIAIAIAKNSNVKMTAIDISRPALQTAENNAKKQDVKVDFICSDLFAGLKKNKKFDIIVSNPPYIKSGDIEKLDIEVKKFDPKLALDGGNDGLDFYKKIIENSKKHLAKNGMLYFELGIGQAEEVKALMKDAGFSDIEIIKDYNKIERIIYGRVRN